jgi:DNA-directed RNA polymerase subunit RPC12/RpoP
MALIKCKECGAEISSKAESCPKCGVRVAAKPMGCGKLIGVIILGIVIISVFSSIFSSGSRSGTSSAPPSTNSASSGQTVSIPAPPRSGSQWYYHHSDDPMGKGVNYQARVLSSNTVNFDFPYSGTQHARLALRIHPRYGKDVIFGIEKGQILCHSYEDCTVLVRFDDKKPTNYSAVGAADNSTETIFIRNYDRFIGEMLKAKRVRIAVNIYQEGTPVFDFDVSGFDQEKYQPKR